METWATSSCEPTLLADYSLRTSCKCPLLPVLFGLPSKLILMPVANASTAVHSHHPVLASLQVYVCVGVK